MPLPFDATTKDLARRYPEDYVLVLPPGRSVGHPRLERGPLGDLRGHRRGPRPWRPTQIGPRPELPDRPRSGPARPDLPVQRRAVAIVSMCPSIAWRSCCAPRRDAPEHHGATDLFGPAPARQNGLPVRGDPDLADTGKAATPMRSGRAAAERTRRTATGGIHGGWHRRSGRPVVPARGTGLRPGGGQSSHHLDPHPVRTETGSRACRQHVPEVSSRGRFDDLSVHRRAGGPARSARTMVLDLGATKFGAPTEKVKSCHPGDG